MRIAVIANKMKEGIRVLLPVFHNTLEKYHIEPVYHEDIRAVMGDRLPYRSEQKLFEGAELIISFGGDGTILHTARISAGTGIPIMGINLGKVGFLAEISPDEIEKVTRRLSTGDYEIIERTAFCARTNEGKSFFALNDIVIDRSSDTRILEFSASVDGIHAGDFTADGIIIATPTGSTAHSVSAGGPLVMPDCDVIVVTPICPHSLTFRPLIINGGHVVGLDIVNGVARMAVDGQSFVTVNAGCHVDVMRYDKTVKIVRFRDKTYFDILHTRLNWGVSLKLRNA